MESTTAASRQLIAGEWKVDAVHSQVLVTVRHMAVASMRAKFPKISGALEVDARDPLASSFGLEIDATAVTTGHPDQEDFIRSKWLDAEKHPTITFQGTRIRRLDEEEYVVSGELTLKGVTRAVDLPFRFQGVVSDRWGLRAGFTSQLTLQRGDFGITWNRRFDWGVMADEALQVTLDIELVYPDEKLASPSTEVI